MSRLAIAVGLAACVAGCDDGAIGSGGAGGVSAASGGPVGTTVGGPGATGATTGKGAGPGTGASSSSGIAPGKVSVMVAQGEMGRTTMSCDGGHTWIENHAWDLDADPILCDGQGPAVCYEGSCNYFVGGECIQRSCCDHAPDNSKGVAFGAGRFVATWGWGAPGVVRSSTDAVAWHTTLPDDSFGGIAYGGGRFVVASRTPYWSEDGETWHASAEADFQGPNEGTIWSVRRFAYAETPMGGRFVAVASGNTDRDVLVSSDGGETWWRPSSLPDDCAQIGSTYGGIVSGNGIIVVVDDVGRSCRSTDGGDTWTVSSTGLGMILSHGVFTGTEFWFWGDDSARVESTDGETWHVTPMTTPTRIGPVARSSSGALMALNSVWTGYDQQTFLRSDDGLTWTELDPGAFAPSHPIFYLAEGAIDPTAACPLP